MPGAVPQQLHCDVGDELPALFTAFVALQGVERDMGPTSLGRTGFSALDFVVYELYGIPGCSVSCRMLRKSSFSQAISAQDPSHRQCGKEEGEIL